MISIIAQHGTDDGPRAEDDGSHVADELIDTEELIGADPRDAEDAEDAEDADDDLDDEEGPLDRGSSLSSSSLSSLGSLERERQRGDGEEEHDEESKKVDDDEDRRNPQYIPKRGIFYEHDDRTADDP